MQNILQSSEVSKLLRELISIPSVNPDLAPEEGCNESKIAEFICGWLKNFGIKASIEETVPGRPNVYAEIGDGNGPTLCLLAHTDTVGTAGMLINPFDPKIENGKIFGRGSCDMKAGLAAEMIAAAAIALEGKIKGKLILAFVADEEFASIGAEQYVLRHKADACILTEPTDLNLVLGHKGFAWANIITRGKAAHGSRWDLGDSAISKMGKIISALDDFDKGILRQREHALVGPASMHSALINGGVGISTYAPECSLRIERRSIPGEEIINITDELIKVVRATGEQADVDVYFSRPPFLCNTDEPIVTYIKDSILSVTGTLPTETGSQAWTDAAIFSSAGIPTVIYGPAGGGIHEEIEWVDLDSVVIVAQTLKETISRVLR